MSLDVAQLLRFLHTSSAPTHLAAVRSLWQLQATTKRRHVEAAICQLLTSSDESERQLAFEAFGNLWRYTDDWQLPGVVLGIPMHIMLDALRSPDLAMKRAGEAWMRCSLKSYIRWVDVST